MFSTLNLKARTTLTAFLAAIALSLGLAAPSTSHAGNWEWWGYRNNSWQTWAIATQSPDFIKRSGIPYFNVAAYIMGTQWKWNAQNARRMGTCTGITWSGTSIFAGCSNR